MKRKRSTFLSICLSAAFLLGACNAPVATTTAEPVSEEIATEEAAEETTTLTVTNTPEPTPTPVIDTSLYTPEITSTTTEVIYEQYQRARLGGRDTFFWPDGNLGLVPLEDGQFRFFAANSTRTAVSVGTLDDPGAVVESNKLTISGVDPEFDYASGGPIYRDPESGLLLMFYHAERHLGGNGLIFHAAIGLAVSNDEGATFENLGIIIETNAEPDRTAPCCADMGGATYTIKDGHFMVYFKDRLEDLTSIELAVATAPVDEVLAAAKIGNASPWAKYQQDGPQPGLSGTSTPLEIGNPPTDWFSISYNTALERYVMAIATHDRAEEYDYQLYLTTSVDGYIWSPRVLLLETEEELTYPSLLSVEGDPLNTGKDFYIYYVTTPRGTTRWHNTTFHRMTVSLTGEMLEPTHGWEFDTDTEGWAPLWDMGAFDVQDGALVIESTGNDPYMASPSFVAAAENYSQIEVRMKSGVSGTGQFFFTTDNVPYHVEEASVTFLVKASDTYETYIIDMSSSSAWTGYIGGLRFDPIDKATTIEIDYVRLIP